MANNIELIKKYGADMLDEIFVAESKSAILEDLTGRSVKASDRGAKEYLVADIALTPLGNYNRATGFPDGDVNLTWTPYVCTQDRGRSFSIDKVEDTESAGLTSANLLRIYEREHIIPEVDAYRFSTLAKEAGKTVTEKLTAENVLQKLNDGIAHLTNEEVNTENVVAFISAEVEGLLKLTPLVSRIVTQEEFQKDGVTFKISRYDNIKLITVPQRRFKTEYTFDNTGFKPTEQAKDINFILTHFDAALPYKKHEAVRVFDPSINQTKDAWLFQVRIYHDFIVPKNKKNGVYVSVKNGTAA